MLRLRIDPTEAAPIWRQIEEGVRRQVAAGGLTSGEAVPSVRDLARELVVNPATVVKAYQRLVDAGVLVVRRGEGTFVADAPPLMAKGERRGILREAAARYAGVAATIGASAGEAIDELQTVMARFERATAAADRIGDRSADKGHDRPTRERGRAGGER